MEGRMAGSNAKDAEQTDAKIKRSKAKCFFFGWVKYDEYDRKQEEGKKSGREHGPFKKSARGQRMACLSFHRERAWWINRRSNLAANQPGIREEPQTNNK